MTGPHHQPDDAAFEAYLDGALSGDELASMEQRISADPALQRHVQAQRRIDATLRRRFEPGQVMPASVAAADVDDTDHQSGSPVDVVHSADANEAPPAVAGRIEPAAAPTGKSGRSQWRLGLIAAVLMLGAGAIYYFGPLGPGHSDSDEIYKPRERPPVLAQRPTADGYYASVVNAGFKPLWVCKDDEEFKKTTRDRLGAPLLVKPDPAITLVGWTYGQTPMSDDTSVLLARVDGKEVVVLLDRAGGSCRTVAQPDASSKLHVYSRTLGGVMMYEISPRDASAVIDRVYDAGA